MVVIYGFDGNADRLLLLQIELGDRQKQIMAGIRGHYRPEELVGRQIVVLDNQIAD